MTVMSTWLHSYSKYLSCDIVTLIAQLRPLYFSQSRHFQSRNASTRNGRTLAHAWLLRFLKADHRLLISYP